MLLVVYVLSKSGRTPALHPRGGQVPISSIRPHQESHSNRRALPQLLRCPPPPSEPNNNPRRTVGNIASPFYKPCQKPTYTLCISSTMFCHSPNRGDNNPSATLPSFTWEPTGGQPTRGHSEAWTSKENAGILSPQLSSVGR